MAWEVGALSRYDRDGELVEVVREALVCAQEYGVFEEDEGPDHHQIIAADMCMYHADLTEEDPQEVAGHIARIYAEQRRQRLH